jgi:hypothetical protein
MDTVHKDAIEEILVKLKNKQIQMLSEKTQETKPPSPNSKTTQQYLSDALDTVFVSHDDQEKEGTFLQGLMNVFDTSSVQPNHKPKSFVTKSSLKTLPNRLLDAAQPLFSSFSSIVTSALASNEK